MKIPTCLCARLRGGGPEAARRSGQSSTAPAGDRLSTITRALLNGLKVLSRAALFRSPGYVAELRRKRFRSARRRRANFDVRPIVDEWTHAGRQRRMAWLGLLLRIWALSALALALFITALPPPSLADVGQADHDNASAAGLQLEAPLNEHESRCTTAARVMQTKVSTKAEGAAAEGEAAAAAMAAGSARPPLLQGCGHHHSST